MIRPDIEMLSRMVRKKIISQQLANELVARPLMIIPTAIPDTDYMPKWMENIQINVMYSCSGLPDGVLPPFNEFVAVVDKLYVHVVLENNRLTSISYCYTHPDAKIYVRLLCLPSPAGDINCIFKLDRFYQPGEVVVYMDDDLRNITSGQVTPELLRKQKIGKTILNNVNEVLAPTLAIIMSFIEYHDTLGLYPVKVEREKKPRKGLGSREQLERHQGAHLIYLDKLPSQSSTAPHNGSSTPSSAHVRPHERRGHTKTLKHPRYKDHPLYMVENAIRVKPSWVGDKSAIVNGNIYTVLG